MIRVGDAIAGRPGGKGWLPVAVQLLLVLLWHPVIMVVSETLFNVTVESASRFWRETGLTSVTVSGTSSVYWPEANAILFFAQGLFWTAVVVALEGAIAYIPFRIVARRAKSVWHLFPRSWWRACLWGTALMPLLAMIRALLPAWSVLEWLALCIPVYLVAAPAFLAGMELRKRQRLPRWRPVCPECGYSLRRAYSERCPECGGEFPTKSRTFRRWAIQRLIWDRLNRGSLVFAYVRSTLMITFCPCRAAWRLSIPDRRGRAIRWAAVHLLVATLLCTVLGQEMYLVRWVLRQFFDPPFEVPELAELWRPPAGRVVLWSLQSLSAWLVAITALPMLGIALGVAVPGRHPAARRGIVKWSLYACFMILLVPVASYIAVFALMPWGRQPVQFVLQGANAPGPPLVLLAGLYSVWWARGVCVNPYLRARGIKVLLANWLVFMVAWLTLRWLLFSPGPLGGLL